ncbi:MAG: hypothetical protein J6Q65_07775, partial [Lentisphaeria bacterium]|nr:hypothetical protein [Lentisphaeria bacterium]
LRRYISEIGTIVVALALALPALSLILWQDLVGIVKKIREDRKNAPAPAPVPVPSPSPSPAPAPAVAPAPAPVEEDEPPFDPGTDADNTEKPRSFWSKLFAGNQKESVPEPASTPESAPVDDDDYAVVPPRSVVVNPTAAPGPVYTPAPPPPPQQVYQPAPAASRPEPVRTPVGIQPAISQFSDQNDRSGKPALATRHSSSDYELPSVKLLDQHNDAHKEDMGYLEKGRERLQQVLDSFSVAGHVENIVVGPRVTRADVLLDEGVEVGKITRISQNIAMKMEAASVRLLAPIPGRDAVGIEVPNKISSTVYIRSVMESEAWVQNSKPIPIVLGRDVEGKAIVTDLSRAPHMLIAGSTGSGKSVCMNTLIMSMLFKFSPEDLRLILVDPKVVEMAAYASIPHLITPVVNDPKKVPLALRWGVNEMERRYRIMAKVLAKDMKTFNARPVENPPILDDEGEPIPAKLPFLVIIIDELADIMMTEAKKDVENSICRIAQKGRAAGIHLVIATQTPRKDVITGMIKANLPVKIAFRVGSNMDSRVILDQGGAEKLLGMGDLLFCPPGASNLERIQMTLVTDDEIKRIVDFCSSQVEQHFDSGVLAEDVEITDGSGVAPTAATASDDEWDQDPQCPPEIIDSAIAKYLRPGDPPLLKQALELVINERQASISLFQRRLGIGYNKSAELVELLEQRNIVSKPLGGGQKREILILDGLEVAE